MKKIRLVLVIHWDEEKQVWSQYETFLQDDFTIDVDEYFAKLYGKNNYEYKFIDGNDLSVLEYHIRLR